MAFALELMGAKDVRNYFHGWSQWGNQEGLPVMLPKEEKQEAADNQEE
jgi:3-mercaptopyruvate sulfurtransferase SseA